jgi:large subunit ribosomal protein L10
VAFVKGEETVSARAVIDAFRPYRVIRVTGGLLGDRVISAEDVIRLSQLPSRDVLLAEVAGAVAAPMASLAGLFDAPLRDIAGLVGALAENRAA